MKTAHNSYFEYLKFVASKKLPNNQPITVCVMSRPMAVERKFRFAVFLQLPFPAFTMCLLGHGCCVFLEITVCLFCLLTLQNFCNRK